MRIRPVDANGFYTLGVPFLVNTPQAVAQLISTRLQLWQGEWFVDTTDGTPYLTGALAERYGKDPDSVIKQRILGTQGVTSILAYTSSFDGKTRVFTANATVQTKYGVAALKTKLVQPPGP